MTLIDLVMSGTEKPKVSPKKELLRRRFCRTFGRISGVICLKTLVLLGSALKLFRKVFGTVHFFGFGVLFWPLVIFRRALFRHGGGAQKLPIKLVIFFPLTRRTRNGPKTDRNGPKTHRNGPKTHRNRPKSSSLGWEGGGLSG